MLLVRKEEDQFPWCPEEVFSDILPVTKLGFLMLAELQVTLCSLKLSSECGADKDHVLSKHLQPTSRSESFG